MFGSVHVGVVANEFFHPGFGGYGGFGWAARMASRALAPARRSGVRVSFVSGARRTSTQRAVHGVPILLPDKDGGVWRRRLEAERFDLLLTVDHRTSYRAVMDVLDETPTAVWVRAPVRPELVAHYMTLRVPGDDAPPFAVRPIDTTALADFARRRPAIAFASIDPALDPFVEQSYGVGTTQPLPLPNAIDLGPAAPKSQRPLVAFLGRLDPVKRPWVVMALAERMPDVDFAFVGVAHSKGEGTWDPGTPPPNVSMHGFVDGADKMKILSSAWLAINTSITEGIPISLLEALACETPLVSCNDGFGSLRPFGYFVDQAGGTGLDLVPEFEAGLRKLIDNADTRMELAHAGREWIARTHSRRRFVECFANICDHLGVRRPKSRWIQTV